MKESPPPRARSYAWLEILALVLFQAVTLAGFTLHIDLHPADEALYQRRGQSFLEFDFDRSTLVFAPVYSAVYAPLRLLPLPGDTIQDTMGVLVVLASTLSVWWAMRALLPRPAALLCAVWWGASLPVLGNPLRLYLFTTMLTTLAIGCAARGRSGWAAVVLALAALNRPELLPWLLTASFGLAVVAVRRRAWRSLVVPATACAAGIVFLLVLASPEQRHRQWFTFRWDYAAHFATKDDVTYEEGRVLTRADALIEETFPGCRSVGDALRQNPSAVLGHVGRNLGHLPTNLWNLMTLPWWHAPRWRGTVVIAALAAMVAGVAVAWRTRRRPRRATFNWPAAIVLATSLCVLVPLVVFLPRPDYLMPVAVPLLFAGAWAIARAGSAVCSRLGLGARAARDTTITALAVVMVCVPAPFTRPPAMPCANRDAVALLARQTLPADAVVLAATGAGLRTLTSKTFVVGDLPALLSGTFTPAPGASCYLLVGPWDLLGGAVQPLVAQLSSQRWDLVDAGAECWLFAWRG